MTSTARITFAALVMVIALTSCRPSEGTRTTCGHLSLVIPVGYKLDECNDGHRKPTAVDKVTGIKTVSGIYLLHKDREEGIDIRIFASKDSDYFIGLFGESTDFSQLESLEIETTVWRIWDDHGSAFADIPGHSPMIFTVLTTDGQFGTPSGMDVAKLLEEIKVQFVE